MGKVNNEPTRAGFHIVNPFMDFTEFDTKEQKVDLTITIPAQDKFSSTADLSIRYSFDGERAPQTLKEIGDMKQLVGKIIYTPLVSLVKEAGRSIKVSQDLFTESTQKVVESRIHQGLIEETAEYGIKIHAVYLGNIQLDEIIMAQIRRTKELQEKEEQQRAILERESLEYERGVRKAKAEKDASLNKKETMKNLADAKFYSEKRTSDAKLYAKQMEAKANVVLSKSITSELLKLKKLDIEMKRAENWKGGVPQTVMGDAAKTLPLYKVN